MWLSDLKPGSRCRVGTCDGLPCRIMEMGLLPGTVVEVARVAPLGDPICLKLNSCHLAIRREDASRISVQAV